MGNKSSKAAGGTSASPCGSCKGKDRETAAGTTTTTVSSGNGPAKTGDGNIVIAERTPDATKAQEPTAAPELETASVSDQSTAALETAPETTSAAPEQPTTAPETALETTSAPEQPTTAPETAPETTSATPEQPTAVPEPETVSSPEQPAASAAEQPATDGVASPPTEVQEFSIADRKLKLGTAEDVREHVEFIRAHRQLKIVALNGNTFGVDAAKALAEAVDGLEDIEEFHLNDGFTGRMKEEVHICVEAFAHVLKTKEKLRRVDFSDNAFGPVGAKAVAILLEKAGGLEELILNNNGLGPEGGRIIAQALLDVQGRNEAAERASALRRLEIGRNRLENGSAELMSQALRAHGRLEEISLPQNGIRPEGVAELCHGIAGNPALIKLNLQDNTFTTVGSQALAVALGKLDALQTLNIGDCLLGSQGCDMIVDALAAAACPLESLNLQYNEMSEEGVKNIIRHLDKFAHLKVLMLNGNSFNPVGEAATELKETLKRVERRDMLDSWSDMEWYSEDDDEDDDEE